MAESDLDLVMACARLLVEEHGWEPFHAIEQANRFWKKVDRVLDEESCWMWTATLNAYGRPQVYWNGRLWMAGRVALWMATGVVPEKNDACHTCDNPPCVRPDHLWWGSRTDNVRDMMKKGRAAWQVDPEFVKKTMHRHFTR